MILLAYRTHNPKVQRTLSPAKQQQVWLRANRTYNPTCQCVISLLNLKKHKVMTMDELLDSHPLPTNLYEVKYQTTWKDFHFLKALNPMTVKSEAPDSLSSANSFGNFEWNPNTSKYPWKHVKCSIGYWYEHPPETSITIPTNTSDRLFPNSTEAQHEETNTQTEVQPYDRKNKICRKVIDETTLRIYFPRHFDTFDTISTICNEAALRNLLERQHPVSTLSRTKATVSLG